MLARQLHFRAPALAGLWRVEFVGITMSQLRVPDWPLRLALHLISSSGYLRGLITEEGVCRGGMQTI